MAGKIDDGGVSPNPSMREGRAYADGVEARMKAEPPVSPPAPNADSDPAGYAAYTQGVTDAVNGVPADSATAYAGQSAV